MRDGSSEVLPVTGSSWTPSVYFVAFRPDGRYVAAGNFDGSLWIWDLRTPKLVAKWRGHTGGVWCTEFTGDGNGLMNGGLDNSVRYWDLSSLGNQQGASTGMVVYDFPVVQRDWGHKWNAESGVGHLTLQGHTDWIRGVNVSRTQSLLATASEDGHVTVWKYLKL